MFNEFEVIPSIIGILVLVIPSLIFGKLCSHFKISEVIGFVIAGIIFGPFAIGGIIPFYDKPLVVLDDLVMSFWQISGIIILFAAGLHFTFHDLQKAGFKSTVVGIGGIVTPLTIGFFVSVLLGFDWIVSVLIGTALSATSIVISVTILDELKKEKTNEGNILVNAAVLDDVLGLAILSAVVSIIISNSIPNIETVFLNTVEAISFWFLVLLGSVFILPKIVHAVSITRPSSLESRGTNQAIALGSAFGIAAIAGSIGLNPIVGAFAAGMGLAGSKFVLQIREFVGRLKVMFAPLFFAIMGAHVEIGKIGEVDWIIFFIILTIATLSKIIGCGLPASVILKSKQHGLRVGYGMIARGEIAFITAGFGLSYGIFNDGIYSTLIFVILGTILISATLLRNSFGSKNNEIIG
ncbi:MAG: cation:proton antiporter [Nitrosarchaeum sp.]|nr:cation:proton antiporter [Nitrosarchaeum sp.]